MSSYFLYRSMVLNGLQASHIVHYYMHKYGLTNKNFVSFQRWPTVNPFIGPTKKNG